MARPSAGDFNLSFLADSWDFHLEYDMRTKDRERDYASWYAVRPLFWALVLVFACILAAAAQAATAQLTCAAPTQNTNGTPISAMLTYKAYWGTSATSLANASALAGPGCLGSVVVPDPAAGTSITYHFAVTAIANGQESAKSNVATKAFTTPIQMPNPPTLLLTLGGDVNVASPNYTNFSWKLGAKAGTIAPNIKCDASRKIGEDYYRVTGPVVWTSGKKDYVVAKCERRA
jgi:hypothetical protein